MSPSALQPLEALELMVEDLAAAADDFQRGLAVVWIDAQLDLLQRPLTTERMAETKAHLEALRRAQEDLPLRLIGAVVVGLLEVVLVGPSSSPVAQPTAAWIDNVMGMDPYGDVRISVRADGLRVVNVSKMARWQDKGVDQVVAELVADGARLFDAETFERRARELMEQVRSGVMVMASPAVLGELLADRCESEISRSGSARLL